MVLTNTAIVPGKPSPNPSGHHWITMSITIIEAMGNNSEIDAYTNILFLRNIRFCNNWLAPIIFVSDYIIFNCWRKYIIMNGLTRENVTEKNLINH